MQYGHENIRVIHPLATTQIILSGVFFFFLSLSLSLIKTRSQSDLCFLYSKSNLLLFCLRLLYAHSTPLFHSLCVLFCCWRGVNFLNFHLRIRKGPYLSVIMVSKSEKTGGGEAVAPATAAASNHPSRRKRGFNKPSWLLCSIADLDERMKMLIRKIPKGKSPDSFSERANSYYHERPQLLALLDDLYNGYLSLADRYCQILAKNQQQQKLKPHSRCSSPIQRVKLEDAVQPDEGDAGEVIDSDAESSLSFQPPTVPLGQTREVDADIIVADLVMKAVEYDIVQDELAVVEKKWSESSRKMELQKNLLDVLESERLILLNDNATLGYRVSALAEENQGLASESMFLKRKAAELARCVLKTREDHRVCMLSRKIEDLQGQIYGLEKRNKEYYEQLVKQEEKNVSKGLKSKGGDQVNLEDCFRVGSGGGALRLSKCFSFNLKKPGDQNSNCNQTSNGDLEGKKVLKMWDKVKKFDLFQCGSHFDAAAST